MRKERLELAPSHHARTPNTSAPPVVIVKVPLDPMTFMPRTAPAPAVPMSPIPNVAAATELRIVQPRIVRVPEEFNAATCNCMYRDCGTVCAAAKEVNWSCHRELPACRASILKELTAAVDPTSRSQSMVHRNIRFVPSVRAGTEKLTRVETADG